MKARNPQTKKDNLPNNYAPVKFLQQGIPKLSFNRDPLCLGREYLPGIFKKHPWFVLVELTWKAMVSSQ